MIISKTARLRSHPAALILAACTVVVFSTLASACKPLPANTTWPARGTFIYPWYPESWTTPAPHDLPAQGEYSSAAQLARQVSDLNYAKFRFAVSSWWGPGHYTDQRFQPLLNAAHGTPLKIVPYYEAEGNRISAVSGSPNPTTAQITKDLEYIAARYIADPNYMWVHNKPVIFVYGDSSDSCSTATRWSQANAASSTHFYIVLKVFTGWATCTNQPDNWHQYAPSSAYQQHGWHSVEISPGFYKYSESTPRLVRNLATFTNNLHTMNCSGANLQLVTTYNEWGEDTGIEPGGKWGKTYLDVLHNNPSCTIAR